MPLRAPVSGSSASQSGAAEADARRLSALGRILRAAGPIALRHFRQPITVEDKGIGIDPSDVPHIFEPFYRGQEALASQIHGTGLGLCMVRKSATDMGGDVTVKSAPGKGSIFTIHLPAMPPDAAVAMAGAKPS